MCEVDTEAFRAPGVTCFVLFCFHSRTVSSGGSVVVSRTRTLAIAVSILDLFYGNQPE
jgi:hypothetical protein